MSARPSSRSRTGASSAMSASIRGGSAAPWSATCAPAGSARAAARSASSSPRPASSPPPGHPTRKAQEALIALWLEAWLSKEEILSRYLSNVYFGDNVYGLRAAARHYFNVEPEELTPVPGGDAGRGGQRAEPARADHAISKRRGAAPGSCCAQWSRPAISPKRRWRRPGPARVRRGPRDDVPTGTYFADWVLPQASELADEGYGQRLVQTTLEGDLQRARRAHRPPRRPRPRPGGPGRDAARRPGGRHGRRQGLCARSPFNRAVQARRQPGSAFKLFVYLAAFRHGLTRRTRRSTTCRSGSAPGSRAITAIPIAARSPLREAVA